MINQKELHLITPRIARFVALVSLSLGVSAAAMWSPLADHSSGFSQRPIGTQPASVAVPEDTLQFFKDKNFKDNMTQISEVSAKQPWIDHDFGTSAKNYSSMRWNLPRGVVVTVFGELKGTGKALSLWGSGEIAELSDWKLNDELSCWSWNGVGGLAEPSKNIKAGTSDRPRYAKTVDSVPAYSLQLFRNRDCKGDMTPITEITAKESNTFHSMPSGTSSMRWNIPEGVIVVFANESSGQGTQIAVWGSGQFDTFALWQMNDKMKYYAWHWIGEKAK